MNPLDLVFTRIIQSGQQGHITTDSDIHQALNGSKVRVRRERVEIVAYDEIDVRTCGHGGEDLNVVWRANDGDGGDDWGGGRRRRHLTC